MSHRRFAVNLCLLSCTAFMLMTPVSGSERARSEPSTASRSIVVTTTAELVAALTADPGYPTIYVERGTYLLDHAIKVPDGTALVGEGEMLYDDGLPTGFVTESRTVIAAIAGVTGDFVTLGNNASLQGLVIQDVIRPTITGGSVVAVSSRKPSDSVSAQVAECEVISPNPAGSATTGPTGRGLLANTKNSRVAGGGPSHEQSLVSVHLTQSIIRSPGLGDAIFAINVASGSHIELHVRRNVIGKLGANGGVSSPDSTVGATTLVQSTENLYRADNPASTSIGWQLQGGSDAPAATGVISEETLNNKLSLHSVDDRIEGFGRAISATGGQRLSALSGAISSNETELILQGTRLVSTTADLQLFGARNLAGVADGNELRVTMHNVIGSGSRTNAYGDMSGSLGIGNRLIITGNVDAFSRTNEAISPVPGEQFFTGGDGGPLLLLQPVRFQIKKK